MRKILLSTILVALVALVGCGGSDDNFYYGEKFTLGGTNWQGTRVYTETGENVTEYNGNFIGLARYDDTTNLYEFFNRNDKTQTRQKGVFFVTQDGAKRILKPDTGNAYIVDMLILNPDLFTYKRNGVNANNESVLVFVDHVPYNEQLNFTITPPNYTHVTGTIDKSKPGRDILSSTLWKGTVAKELDNGTDASQYNQNFLGLARYDSTNSKYEFFYANNGTSRGDYGYYDVILDNKARIHVAIDKDKDAYSNVRYFAEREISELNDKKFTYIVTGRNADNTGNVTIYVEHEPYTGEFPLEFTF